jgi:hypothetical protein
MGASRAVTTVVERAVERAEAERAAAMEVVGRAHCALEAASKAQNGQSTGATAELRRVQAGPRRESHAQCTGRVRKGARKWVG